ncbi:hypothetical protein KIPB_013452, partial [Kipferlia bialata]
SEMASELRGPRGDAHLSEAETLLGAEASEFSRVYYSANVELYAYTPEIDNGRRTFVLVIPTFSPNDVMDYAVSVTEALDLAKEHRCSHLIVSVISNGGGYVSLGYLTLHALQPNTFPEYGDYSIRHNTITDHLLHKSFETIDRYHLLTWAEYPADTWYYPGDEYSFEDTLNNDVEFSHTYSSR